MDREVEVRPAPIAGAGGKSFAASMTRWARAEGPALLGLVAVAMALAWLPGQEVGWDLRNYRFYTPHLLFDDRFGRDIEPAGVQSYFNPLLGIPFYLAVKVWKLTPLIVSLGHAAFHGLNLWLVYRLVRVLLAGAAPGLAAAAAPVAALTAAFGAAFMIEVGSTADDITMSVIVLAALTVLIAGVRTSGPALRSVWMSGLLIGVATGAKLVAAMYAVGLLAAVLVIGSGFRHRLVRAISFAAAGLAGALLAHGYWMWLMFEHFGSPLFPFVDASMRSPYVPVTQYLASQFMPRTVAQAIFYPFYFVVEQKLVAETPFRDPRLAAAFVSVVVWGVAAAIRRWRTGAAIQSDSDARILGFVVFAAVSYVVWEGMSSVYRFAISLELTAAALLIASAAFCLRSRVRSLAVSVPACVVLVLCTKPAAGALVHAPWSPTYFGVDERALEAYGDATILMWDFPNAYIVPFFPSSTTFIRIRSNWPYAWEPDRRRTLERRILGVDRSQLYLLDLPQEELWAKQQALALFGLRIDQPRCRPLSSLFEHGRICGVTDERSVSAAPTSEAGTIPPTYEGFHDVVNCNGIMGWAWDAERPEDSLEVDVYDGTRMFRRVTADQFRSDLLQAKKGNGRHGFTIPTPPELRDGRPHEIYMKYAGTSWNLDNGPRHLTCSPL